jgi:hypothetical protein
MNVFCHFYFLKNLVYGDIASFTRKKELESFKAQALSNVYLGK